MLNLTTLPAVPREPTAADLLEAEGLVSFGRAVKRAAYLAALRQKRREARALRPRRHPKFPTESLRCGWCGVRFRGRVLGRPAIGRYCTHSCRTMAYDRRKRLIERREALRARARAEMT